MNEKELRKLLARGETDVLEFKENPNESFYKNISAFANTKGGTIILGADNNGNIKGIDPSGKFLEDLTNRIVNKLSIYPDISAIDIKGNRTIAINIARSSYPVSYKGRYYERTGNTTREMKAEKLRHWFLRGKPWDSLTDNYSLNDIDTETVSRFIQLAVENKRLIDTSLDEPPQLVLQKLGFMKNDELTNGAIILFGKDPQKHFINLCIRIGRFKTETMIIDDKWVKGYLY